MQIYGNTKLAIVAIMLIVCISENPYCILWIQQKLYDEGFITLYYWML